MPKSIVLRKRQTNLLGCVLCLNDMFSVEDIEGATTAAMNDRCQERNKQHCNHPPLKPLARSA
jgi:hypothetical protein